MMINWIEYEALEAPTIQIRIFLMRGAGEENEIEFAPPEGTHLASTRLSFLILSLLNSLPMQP